MSEDPQHFESVAPEEGDKIIDRQAAISDPQTRVATPKTVGGANPERKGVKVVTRRGTKGE